MIGGVLSEIDFGNATFLDYLCSFREAKTLQVLSLRFPNSPLTSVCPQLSFSVGTLVRMPIPGLIRESRTSKRLSIWTSVVLEVGPYFPVLWCSKGVQENGLGTSPLNMTSVVTGDTGSAVFRPGHKHLETGLVSMVKKKDLPLRFQRSLVSVLMTAG